MTRPSPPTIYIDDRAGSRDLVNHPPLTDPQQAVAVLCRLDSADAMFTGNGPNGDVLVGVEVKSLSDFISSANTGRLQATQIPAMLNTYDHSWVLIYGEYSVGDDGELLTRRAKTGHWATHALGRKVVPYGYVENMITDLTMLGVRVKHVPDVRLAVRWLVQIARWYDKPWAKHKGLRTFDTSRDMVLPGVDGDTLLRARVASQLPGLGFERAVAAARHFPSIIDMVNATPVQWAQVEGVGKVIARAVHDAVMRRGG